MASCAQVCDLLGPPERTDAIAAISRTIGLIRRRKAISVAEIERKLGIGRGVIGRAERGENLLEFDTICQLAYIYGDCADPIRQLLDPAPTAEPTKPEDMIQRAQELLLTAQRMMDAA